MFSVFAGCVTALGALGAVPASPAAAAPCADVKVLFARGTTEAVGLGGFGQQFADAVAAQAAPRTVEVTAVDYPASLDFATGVDGVRNARAQVLDTVASCPATQLVLGGYSQGAAIMGFVTADVVPDGVSGDAPQPLEAAVTDHVAAVALLGKPNQRFMTQIRQPAVVIGPAFTAKTIDLCAAGDPICSDGGDLGAHAAYAANGMVDEAATYAVSRLKPPTAVAPRPAPQ